MLTPHARVQVLGLTRPADVKRQFLRQVFQQLEESVSRDAHPDGGSDQVLGDPDWKQVAISHLP